mgnify:CR=1 FL=1
MGRKNGGFTLIELIVVIVILLTMGNQIQNVKALAGLSELQHLDLSDNRIADIAPIAGLSTLEWLRLEGNLRLRL